jgi:hypothetical protein
MARKTRKQRGRGRGLANLFRKKTPLTSQASVATVAVNKTGNAVSYTRKASLNSFVNLKKRKAIVAKGIRNHIRQLKALDNDVRTQALSFMNANARMKDELLLNQPNLNSLSDDQLLELYQTGKVRSLSQ